MYTDFYRLTAVPFQLTPDHRFFFNSRQHRKAMAYLSYGLSKGEGIVIVTGEIGAGKTTLIDQLLATVADSQLVVAKVRTTQLEADDLLRLVTAGFALPIDHSSKAELLGRLETFLLQSHNSGRRVIIIVDEAQSLRPSALEELRMLTNFGAGHQAVLQIILVGQPEFRRQLMLEGFEQLRQRTIASYHLRALDAEDTQHYIEYRLRQVGWIGNPRFTTQAYAKIFERSGGIPRQINLLCDRMLLFGYLEEKNELAASDVVEVLIDLDEEMAIGDLRVPAAGSSVSRTDDDIARQSSGLNEQPGLSPDQAVTSRSTYAAPRHGSQAVSKVSQPGTGPDPRLADSGGQASSDARDANESSAISDILKRLEALEKGNRP